MHHPRHHIIEEVQGLRAIAVLSVLIYHIWPSALPGGYVGVDVFFVISGFLITGSLVKEFEAKGRIGILGFYARRIRRLLPAATVVSIAVALSIPLFPKGQWPDIVNGIVASAAYVQNWFLAAQAVDYLAGDTKGPMNHFWSLSVEEQYYIIWPLILFPILAVARKAGFDSRKAFGWIIAVVGSGSLAYSVFLTPRDPGIAYFATTTRAWELALGGALAVSFVKDALSSSLRAVLGLAGILGIAVASFAYDESTQFPGYAALLPTLAAAAVIASSGAQTPWSGSVLLKSRLFQYLGDISYSLYLWHWPLIVIYGEVTGRTPGLSDGALILLASCGLAHLSTVFVEDRFRAGSLPIGKTLAAGAGCIAATLVLGLSYLAWSDLDQGPVALQGRPGAMAMVDPRYDWRKEDILNVIPRPETAREDVPLIYKTKCHQEQRKSEVLTCVYGNPAARMKIVMIGDSHAGHLYPAFEELARNGAVYFRGVSKSACLFSLEAFYHPPFKRLYTECLDWSKNVIAWLERERPDLVLISQSPAYPETTLKGMAEAWSRLIAMGLDVRPVRSTPWLGFDADKCIATSKDWSVDCAPKRAVAFREDPVVKVSNALELRPLDLTKYLCDAERCPTVIGGVFVYRDRHHLTATFARSLSEAFRTELSLGTRAN
ncbi:peptidoglycan/LPS O-acetylase OafA/YrhL [Microvirga flocculans]|uniref:Peptidoglycan/LPS O-acetylase OafA/YrhL n=1 Tax=Microvirga flocculans TaxID=217168 RepID=A0A7W6N853_9HYPH|nr:acyltransferase family protein [Microvirga flocculans]MBB4040246.1 peptidoglycan/LPS O-acetylase OafA/YrhL [Microvirga flocculans]